MGLESGLSVVSLGDKDYAMRALKCIINITEKAVYNLKIIITQLLGYSLQPGCLGRPAGFISTCFYSSKVQRANWLIIVPAIATRGLTMQSRPSPGRNCRQLAGRNDKNVLDDMHCTSVSAAAACQLVTARVLLTIVSMTAASEIHAADSSRFIAREEREVRLRGGLTQLFHWFTHPYR